MPTAASVAVGASEPPGGLEAPAVSSGALRDRLRRPGGRDTLKNMHRVWHRPVHIETAVEGERKLLSFDGEKYKESAVSSS